MGQMKKIGFIGVGIMGKSMVRNLMKAGYEVSIYTRTKAKVEDVIGEGALWCQNVAECAKGRDAVILERRASLPMQMPDPTSLI